MENLHYKTFHLIEFPQGLVAVGGNGDEISPLPGYSALSTMMATIKPSSTNAAEYTPTATTLSCPTPSGYWMFNASSVLPPKPYAMLCSCMMDTLRCTAKRGAVERMNYTEYYSAFDSICFGETDRYTTTGTENCVGIMADVKSSQYGAFRYVLPLFEHPFHENCP